MTRTCLLITVLLASTAAPAWAEKKQGSPAKHLPPYIRQLAHFGERPDFSHDGKRVLFVSKVFGDVFEMDITTGKLRAMTMHFRHYGFTRALYLHNGDILLCGPVENFDETDREERNVARDLCELMVLNKSLTKPPVRLGSLCAEGPAVSRHRMTLAWTHRWRQIPDKLKEGETLLLKADIVYDDGVPKLANQRVVFDSRDLPFKMGSLEVQNLVPPEDRLLTFSVYKIHNGTNTDTYVVDTETGEYFNASASPERYDEPEGIFPDGRWTTVESTLSNGRAWPLPDMHKLALDGSGRLERLTYFNDFAGYKGTQGIISDDGKRMIFQIGRSGDEAGEGHGFFLYDFELAAKHRDVKVPPADGAGLPSHLWQGEPIHPWIDVFGVRLYQAFRAGEPWPQLSAAHPDATIEQAYTVQGRFVQRIASHEAIAGFKAGVVGAGGQKFFNIDTPMSGVIFESGKLHATDKPVIDLSKHPSMLIEKEIAYAFAEPIVKKVKTVDELKTRIKAVMPAIELPGAERDTQGKPNAQDIIAWNVTARLFILGEPRDVSDVDVNAVSVTMSRDGRQISDAVGSDVWGDQWKTLMWMVNKLIDDGYAIEPGHVIINGALGRNDKSAPGKYRADFGELGVIEFEMK